MIAAMVANWNCLIADIARHIDDRLCYDARDTTLAPVRPPRRPLRPPSRPLRTAPTPATLAAASSTAVPTAVGPTLSHDGPFSCLVPATPTPVPSHTPARDLATLVRAATSPVPTLMVLSQGLSLSGMRCGDAEATCL